MKKSELVTLVAEKTGFSKKDTEKDDRHCVYRHCGYHGGR